MWYLTYRLQVYLLDSNLSLEPGTTPGLVQSPGMKVDAGNAAVLYTDSGGDYEG